MTYFDPTKRIMVIVDGLLVGVSAIFMQREPHATLYKILSYASRSLTPVEQRYVQTDKEGLALVWGVTNLDCSFWEQIST